jgi:hypothetical protein
LNPRFKKMDGTAQAGDTSFARSVADIGLGLRCSSISMLTYVRVRSTRNLRGTLPETDLLAARVNAIPPQSGFAAVFANDHAYAKAALPRY